jgi:hypothetical protein
MVSVAKARGAAAGIATAVAVVMTTTAAVVAVVATSGKSNHPTVMGWTLLRHAFQ